MPVAQAKQDNTAMNKLSKPCTSCPWHLDATVRDIPSFDMALAEKLSATCPDISNMGPDVGARIFACHQSKQQE
jgi:hypothetical protein